MVYLSSVCLTITRVYCAKTAERIEMPFGGKTYGDMCHIVSKGVALPQGKGQGRGIDPCQQSIDHISGTTRPNCTKFGTDVLHLEGSQGAEPDHVTAPRPLLVT